MITIRVVTCRKEDITCYGCVAAPILIPIMVLLYTIKDILGSIKVVWVFTPFFKVCTIILTYYWHPFVFIKLCLIFLPWFNRAMTREPLLFVFSSSYSVCYILVHVLLVYILSWCCGEMSFLI